jgi:Ser/Thr protein kinase RdoA (MazF antagonist)
VKQLPDQLVSALGVGVDFEIASLPGNENENYLIKAHEKAFVVKKLRGQSAPNTEKEAAYREYLAKAGLPVFPYIHLTDGNIVSLLDWEEAGIEPLLIDVAHSAQQFSFERGVCDEALFRAFMQAYREVRPLTQLERQLFNSAFRYGMLALSVWSHIKMSRGEMNSALFQRVGNYYGANYEIPDVN